MWQDITQKALDGMSWLGGIALVLLVMPIIILMAMFWWDGPPHVWHSQAITIMQSCQNFAHPGTRNREVTSVGSIRSFDVWSNAKNMEFDWRWHDAPASQPTKGFARLNYVNKAWTVEFFDDGLKGALSEQRCIGEPDTNAQQVSVN